MQQFVQPRSSSNGYARRKSDRDTTSRFDSKSDISNSNSSGSTFGTGEEIETFSRDRLIYLTTCLIGHQVEVQVLDGSVYSGIFHATNAEDFGVVLKMAQLIKDGSRGQKHVSDSLMKSRTLIIPAKDLVQVIAKGVPVTRDGFTNELQQEKQQELMTDACISQSRHVDLGRELERWVPDENDPECPELENIFDGPYRGWDQFEANQALFGVTSTFDEELYTTKLERGPRTRELEREALRIAREIEGEETLDLHLAEERGIQLDGNLEIDEETRFSSVYRGVDDSGYDEIEDILLDSRNDETFGGVSDSLIGKTLIHTSAEKHAQQLPKNSPVIDASRARDNNFFGPADTSYPEEDKEKQKSQLSKAEVGLSPNAAAFDPSNALSDGQEKVRTELSESAAPPKARPSSSASSASDRGGATSTSAGRGLSPSSSLGSLSSEKSTLNPHAKEFKFNPNAKSFSPSQAPVRPSSPGVDSPCYYPPNMTHMQGVPMGVGPSFASHQPVMFNPQAAALPQQYYHPNGPQYGQQMMMMGQPRPVFYMQPYQPEMPYK